MSNSININQRIPLHVLHTALISHLNGTYSDEYLGELLATEFRGRNRIKKSILLIKSILFNNSIFHGVDFTKESLTNALKHKQDRNLILMALVNSQFEFSYDLFRCLGKFLSIQEFVSTSALKKEMSKKYGGNRALEIALFSVLPMLLESGFIQRPIKGVYSLNENIHFQSQLATEFFIKSFSVNNKFTTVLEYHLKDPYFFVVNT